MQGAKWGIKQWKQNYQISTTTIEGGKEIKKKKGKNPKESTEQIKK